VIGGPSDEVLLRRAARIASRTGAEIIAVHVVPADSVHQGSSDTSLAQELVAEFDGKYREIVDDDTPTAIVSFARSERGTQLILGSSHSRRWYRPFGGVIQNVLRHTPDLDVHVISIDADEPTHVHQRRQKNALPWTRRLLGLACAAVTLSLLTWILTVFRSDLSLSTDFLAYLVIVLGLAALGGAVVGIVAALVAYLLENYYFLVPFHTLSVSRPNDLVALVANLVFAVSASVLVSRFARRTSEADRARAEAKILASAVATTGTSHEDLLPLLDSLRSVFDATSVALVARREGAWVIDVVSGEPIADLASATQFPIDDDFALALVGAALDGEDRQLVSAFAGRVAYGLRAVSSVREAQQFRTLAETEVKRSALMRAVSTDLGGSLAQIQQKVTALLDGGATAPVRVQRDRLLSIEDELQRLTCVVNNLSDLGRLESEGVTPHLLSLTVRPLVEGVIAGLETEGHVIDVDVPTDLPRIDTDPDMAARVLSIVIANALRFSPRGRTVRITAGSTTEAVEILVVDTGPGIKPTQRATMFEPVARTGAASMHLGLSVVSGFMDLLGGEVRLEDTPGGGLTVVLQFPVTELPH
jgi:two-component system sensor histidine kinase KdpD